MLRWTVIVMAVHFGLLQLVPYGWWHSNPPVTHAAVWTDAGAEELARSACYDCHSNETEWPPYAYVAPMSWLVRNDVESGRAALNLSELDQGGGEELDDAAETIEDGEMPPRPYQLLHPAARLTDDEKARLIAAFEVMDDGDDRGGGGDDEDRRGSNRGPG